jgi:ectoine hydroxylase
MQDNYPTRSGNETMILRRQEPVAWQDWHNGAPLTPTQLRSFQDKGFLVLHDLFSAGEVEQLQGEAERLRTSKAVLARQSAITEPDNGALRSLFRPQDASPMVDTVARDARLLDIARFLLAGDVYLHQSRINFKPGLHGKEFYWHSDFETWHAEDGLPAMRTISLSVTLTDNLPWNGPLLMIAGSHRWFISCPGETPANHFRQSLRRQTVGTPDDVSLRWLASHGDVEAVTGPAGTVVLFDSNVMHGSPGNIAPQPRSNLFFVYNSVANLPGKPFCGRPPRPAFVAERQDFTPLQAGRAASRRKAG